MCTHCGCDDPSGARVTEVHGDHHHHGHDHDHHHHDHPHDHHHHDHHHDHPRGTTLQLHQQVLAKNNALAERNRGWFSGRNVLALNLVSSPGAGKTTLLERTLRDLASEMAFHVVEGDQETDTDARRIKATGCPVVQVNTGTGCHLDADMVGRAVQALDPPADSVVLIENVGNLVCPALFDLGERAKVVVVSVTEGEDKPLKYPHMFRAGSVLLLNKVDLLPHVSFDLDLFLGYVRQVNPRLRTLPLSATRGDGLAGWYDWLRAQRQQRQPLFAPEA
jgi:hydrogenase nickel incorporation protein HypB